MKTYFLPAERLPKEDVLKQYKHIISNLQIEVINAIPEIVIILNKFRQIVFCNNKFSQFLGKKVEDILGYRPGEILNCVYSTVNEGGCGTSKFCKLCGAANAIHSALQGDEKVEECNILTKNNKNFIFKVKTTPVKIGGINYLLFTVKDIENEKALKTYQKLLFIDIIEKISEIKIAAKVFLNEKGFNVYIDNIVSISEEIIDKINLQKLIILAENNELKVFPKKIDLKEFLIDFIAYYPERLTLSKNASNCEIITDVNLLRTVLEIIVKGIPNAENSKVLLNIICNDEKKVIKIHIKRFLSLEIQFDIFKKETNSNFNFYLAKVIVEDYLNGKFYFETDEKIGTIFYIELYNLEK